MGQREYVTAREAHDRMERDEAVLVCAYDSDDKFRTYPLEGAISFNEFREQLPAMAPNREIFFYCA